MGQKEGWDVEGLKNESGNEREWPRGEYVDPLTEVRFWQMRGEGCQSFSRSFELLGDIAKRECLPHGFHDHPFAPTIDSLLVECNPATIA